MTTNLGSALGEGAGHVQENDIIFWSCSSASPLLIRMPRRAPSPVPTTMAVGVARPSAAARAWADDDRHRNSGNDALCESPVVHIEANRGWQPASLCPS
jgi:hypothetical protein